ncbi:hypothetical protein PVAG01_05040 [Phlyctema vagabunda]|uniref:Ankyrin n=1 Tax=Phlyctema vagabunda TaxID=108571 RepID=A0ABR4PJ95_9HELO
MPLKLSADEIDDLLFFTRTGDVEEFNKTKEEIFTREGLSGESSVQELLLATKDDETDTGILHMAAANGHHSLLSDLCKGLSYPSPQNPVMLSILNAQNKSGNTALHWASLNGHLECVKILLEQGSDPTICNQKGHDAVYEAELNDQKEVVEWVLKEGGDGLEEGVGGDAEGEGEEIGDDAGEVKLEDEMAGVDLSGDKGKKADV